MKLRHRLLAISRNLLSRRVRAWHSLVGALLLGSMLFLAGYRSAPPNYFDISKNLDIFGKALREISQNYVDEVEVNRFVRVGLDAMLKSLDPYTNYYSASEIEDYRFLSTGQYGGIGTMALLRDGGLLITEVQKNSPASENDIRVGDEILRIDNETIRGSDLTAEVANSLLRGQPGTFVEVEFQRPGEPKTLTLKLKRQDIKVDNVPYYGTIENDIAYVSLEGFTRDASLEVRRSLDEIRKANPDIKGIVLDLRGNGGGLLFEAIAISNLFVDQGEVIVETRGRMEGSLAVYQAPNPAYDTQRPVVVLMDGGSASASEIVAGVLQDLDRGVIIGQRSYGKGLVQTTRPLSYNAQMKFTTAKYYTPSGRCIQELDYTHSDAEGGSIKRADSLRQAFKTRNGRPVFDGQGINPDVPIAKPEAHKILKDLQEGYLIFDFATAYRKQNPTIAAPEAFRITDEIYTQFVQFVAARKFDYSSRPMAYLDQLRTNLDKEAYGADMKAQLDALQADLRRKAEKDILTYRPEIARALEAEIITRYYYRTGQIQATFDDDPDIRAALQVLRDPAQYKRLLTAGG